MITLHTTVQVAGCRAHDIYHFMLYCTDAQYNDWWPGTHLAFHTIKRTPSNTGNLVVFDEIVGDRRLKFKGVVTDLVPDHTIVWQMKQLVRLPARLILRLEDTTKGVQIDHTLKVGLNGVLGWLTDPLLRLYLNKKFEYALSDHAHKEFNLLAAKLDAGHRRVGMS